MQVSVRVEPDSITCSNRFKSDTTGTKDWFASIAVLIGFSNRKKKNPSTKARLVEMENISSWKTSRNHVSLQSTLQISNVYLIVFHVELDWICPTISSIVTKGENGSVCGLVYPGNNQSKGNWIPLIKFGSQFFFFKTRPKLILTLFKTQTRIWIFKLFISRCRRVLHGLVRKVLETFSCLAVRFVALGSRLVDVLSHFFSYTGKNALREGEKPAGYLSLISR